MAHQHKIDNLDNSQQVNISIEYPTTCPICHRSIDPVYVGGHMEKSSYAAVTFLCRGCKRAFLTRYLLTGLASNIYLNSQFKESLPVCFEDRKFSKAINDLCPTFSKIYNQSYHAEQLEFTEICGLGYRKAIEHLVKAYYHKVNPDDSSVSNRTPLGTVINKIDDDNIRALAFAVKEIGNGEAHVVQDYNLEDMKDFIEALIYFVDFKLLVLKAKNNFSNQN